MKVSRHRSLSLAAAVVLCVAMVPTVATAAPGAPSAKTPKQDTRTNKHPGFYDARAQKNQQVASLTANSGAAVASLRSQLGTQGIVDIDPYTRTPRQVARLDGFLTGPSNKPARRLAIDYLKAHAAAFGLSAAQIDALKLRQDYVDIEGTHHLSFQQTVGGVIVFGNGIKVDVARTGQLIQVSGSPVAQLPAGFGAAKLTAAQARDAAVKDAAGTSTTSVKSQDATPAKVTTFASGDQAKLVVFAAPGATRLAWQTITMKEGYLHVVDADSGRVLYRQNLRNEDNAPDALVWGNYPGAPRGGQQQRRTLDHWIAPNATTLTGTSAHVFLDINDNDAADAGEEVGPSSPGHFLYPFTDFSSQVGAPCSPQFQCSWNPDVANSWQTNAKQNATQLFFFNSNFHDHLLASPIGFTRAAGNFEFRDGDGVQVNAIDGANTANGLPDPIHTDNANMLTPPDGQSPRMQMYLFPDPSDPTDPFLAANSGDEADVVYHEYTHGLSNRLVVDADGTSTLNGPQSGAMGEAWSDWYAYDYLTNAGLQKDTAAPGEVRVGQYVSYGNNLIRTQPLDCPVGTTSTLCPGRPAAGAGGYTYGDFGKIRGRPEVHSDGEIWVETLWDLRSVLGSKLTESLVTRAMELSPANPSFLDMRNSILMADLVVDHGRKQSAIWKVFANRGMGFFAGATGGDDITPVEDFSLPPAPNAPRGTVTGTVRDQDTNAPVQGAAVGFGGHDSGFAGSYAAVTDAAGKYTIKNVFLATYPKVNATGPGYEPQVKNVTVTRTTVADFTIRRDWAATAGGSKVVTANGDDYTAFGCGPSAIFDMSQGAGWSTDATYTAPNTIDPRFVVVQLPATINLTEIAINPTGTCGDDPTASTGDYRVETSADGTTWTVAASGHFTVANQGKMNSVTLAAGTAGVKFLRYTMLGTQVVDMGFTCPAGVAGCLFVDTVELAAYGGVA